MSSLSFDDVLDSTGVPWPPDHELTWGKVGLIVAGCAVGGVIGGVGLAALVTHITVRRLWEALTE